MLYKIYNKETRIISLNVEKHKLFQRIGHKVMDLNQFSDMTAKLPTFKIKNVGSFFCFRVSIKIEFNIIFGGKEE